MTTTGPVGRLDGKTVLITGGARGQGAAHAERLAREGARVIACDVLQDEGAALSDRLRAEGLDVTYRGLDVTEATAWQGLISEVGRVDVLINNAGIIHLAPIQEQAREAWDATLAVNLTGAMLGIQGFGGLELRHRVRAGGRRRISGPVITRPRSVRAAGRRSAGARCRRR